MKRVMVDIETLSTHKDAAVLSIGVAMFDDDQVIDTAGWSIDMKKITGHINPATVQWWMQQSENAKSYSFCGDLSPDSVATFLQSYLQTADEVWANDPDFDMIILQNWWERTASVPWPVSFRKYRSVRT